MEKEDTSKKSKFYVVSLAQYPPWILVNEISAKNSSEANDMFFEQYYNDEEYIVLPEEHWKEAYESFPKYSIERRDDL